MAKNYQGKVKIQRNFETIKSTIWDYEVKITKEKSQNSETKSRNFATQSWRFKWRC